jgi:hypothetical protein
MHYVKLLVSSLPAVGKTTLLQTLTDALVVSRDGKKFPFPQPHILVPDFTSSEEFIDCVSDGIEAYENAYHDVPKTVVIDSISKVLLDIEGYVLEQVKSYPYGKVNTEIKRVVDFIERDMAPNCNIILVSHAIYNEDISGFQLVNAGGSYGKKGGMLSEVDEAIFLELVKQKKRVIHYRNPKMLARTTLADLPDSESADDFSLQAHLEKLQNKQGEADKWRL